MFQCYSLKSSHLLSPQLWPKNLFPMSASPLLIMADFKSLSCNSNISLLLRLASIDYLCLFSLNLSWVFLWQMIFDQSPGIFQRRHWQPIPVLLPGKSHGWRSLVGCSPWGREELDTTERLHLQFSLSCIGEGNGNPLQGSCLENPRDGGAWWAAVSGVAQSRTRLKWLSSSSSRHFCLVLWDHTVFHPFVLAGFLWHLCRRGRCSAALLLPGGDRSPGFLQGICWHLMCWRLLVSPPQEFGLPTQSSLTLKRWGLITMVPGGMRALALYLIFWYYLGRGAGAVCYSLERVNFQASHLAFAGMSRDGTTGLSGVWLE